MRVTLFSRSHVVTNDVGCVRCECECACVVDVVRLRPGETRASGLSGMALYVSDAPCGGHEVWPDSDILSCARMSSLPLTLMGPMGQGRMATVRYRAG